MRIKALPVAAWLAGATLSTLALPALAHIEYYDLNQGQQIADLTAAGKALAGADLPLSNPLHWTPTYQQLVSSGETWSALSGSFASGTWARSVTVTNFDSSSWTDGLRVDPSVAGYALGDTHKANFANFHLATSAYVSISLTDTYAGQGLGMNPSFSIFRGSAVYQGHDDAAVDPLNPKAGFPPHKVQNGKDTGAVTDSQGITSAYRNTLTNTATYYGQFNAIGDWSQANASGDWSVVQHLASVTGYANPSGDWTGNANSNSLTNLLLGPGDYIIAFGGNAQPLSYATPRSADSTSPYGTVTGEVATLSFSAVAAPVPEPESWMLMLSGAVMLGAVVRRRGSPRAPRP